jgi:hypothetical protein
MKRMGFLNNIEKDEKNKWETEKDIYTSITDRPNCEKK